MPRAPDRTPLTYAALLELVARTGEDLASLGFGPAHRIAVLLPNGPELAAAFIKFSAHLAIAPLNPVYSVAEYRFYLKDLEQRRCVPFQGFVRPPKMQPVTC